MVDHHLPSIHHVRGGPYQTWWDVGFLLLGTALVAGGLALARGARRPAHRSSAGRGVRTGR